MPPKITEVKWNAENVPLGVSFNENTGTFSGEPEEAGEYTVPVTVETNYGIDTKDVIITVEPPTYGVWAIGSNAVTWSNGGTPDEYGFYGLSMPEAYKLVQHPNGFGALTAGGKYYCCGQYTNNIGCVYNVMPSLIDKNTTLKITDTPICPYDERLKNLGYSLHPDEVRILPKIDRVIHIPYSYYYNSKSSSGQKTWYTKSRTGNALFLWSSLLGEGFMYCSAIKYVSCDYSISGQTSEETTWEIFPTITIKVSPENGKTAFDECAYAISMSARSSLPHLPDDKQVTYSGAGGVYFTGKKVFQRYGTFYFLTEDGLLDGNPDNFKYGIIKDAWAYGSAVYVQTTTNQLYQYVSSSKTWDLLGTYDIKKIEIPQTNQIFCLTNDGKLYHKGSAVTGLFDTAHDTLTHIFPALTFKDFTFGANTLTVLRE